MVIEMGGCERGFWSWGRVIDDEGGGDGVIFWGGNGMPTSRVMRGCPLGEQSGGS